MTLPSKWAMGLVLALVLGVAFRLVWPGDIEFKIDELYTFAKTRKFVEGASADQSPREKWIIKSIDSHAASPWLGMPTSKGFYNPGMSLWIFYMIGSVFGADSPPALARGVQLCNVAAILLLLGFAAYRLKGREREWWLWTVAMVCLNPFAVLFERKIWPPCTLPLMMIVFLVCWRSRSARWGAFGWGLLGALAGQIHMSGFIYAAAFFLWTVLYDRKRAAWCWWLAGSLAGVIPLLPWFYYMAINPSHTNEGFLAWWRLISNHFWLAWVTEPFGIGLDYSLGGDFRDFLSRPLLGGHPTYGVAFLHGIALILGLRVLVPGFLRWWGDRRDWGATWHNDQAVFTTSSLQAGFWFFGILLTVSCIRFERHYLLVAFPLVILWAVRLALPAGATDREWSKGRRVLVALCITNALITFMFLHYIHVNGGAPHGDYFRSYGNELQGGEANDPFLRLMQQM